VVYADASLLGWLALGGVIATAIFVVRALRSSGMSRLGRILCFVAGLLLTMVVLLYMGALTGVR
jgi:hypothetical protein